MIKLMLVLLLVGNFNMSNGGPTTTTEPIMVNYDDATEGPTTDPPIVNMDDDDNDDNDDDNDDDDPIVIELPNDEDEDRAAEAVMFDTASNMKERELYKVFDDSDSDDNSTIEVVVPIPEDDEDRVIGGFFSSNGQFPPLARIFPTFSSGQFICGSTVVSNRWVLTAAHCLINGNSQLTSVPIRVGSVNAFSGGQLVFAELAIIHPRYIDFGGGRVSGYDIALLKTRQTISFNRNVQKAYLAGFPNVSPGTRLSTGGWGINSHSLQKGASVSVASCGGLPNNTPSRDSIICVRNTNDRICSGDSGGWLGNFRSGVWVVDGVTSYGPSGCPSFGNSGFTSVGFFQRWIINTARSN